MLVQVQQQYRSRDCGMQMFGWQQLVCSMNSSPAAAMTMTYRSEPAHPRVAACCAGLAASLGPTHIEMIPEV